MSFCVCWFLLVLLDASSFGRSSETSQTAQDFTSSGDALSKGRGDRISKGTSNWANDRTYGHITDARQCRAVDTLIGESGATSTRFQIARSVDTLVNEGLASLDGTSFPTDRADLRGQRVTSTNTGRADLGGGDAG